MRMAHNLHELRQFPALFPAGRLIHFLVQYDP